MEGAQLLLDLVALETCTSYDGIISFEVEAACIASRTHTIRQMVKILMLRTQRPRLVWRKATLVTWMGTNVRMS